MELLVWVLTTRGTLCIYPSIQKTNGNVLSRKYNLYFQSRYVTNASDEEWWQAKRFDHAGNEVSVGIIPSKARWEKKLRSKDRNVSFGGRQSSNQRSNSKKRLPFLKGTIF